MNQKTLMTQTSHLGGSKTEETKIERVTTQKPAAVLQHSHSMTDDAGVIKEFYSLKKRIKIVIT